MRIAGEDKGKISYTFRTLRLGDLFKHDNDGNIYMKTDEGDALVLNYPDQGTHSIMEDLDVCERVCYELKETV